MRHLKIVIPPRAGYFSTLRLLASLDGKFGTAPLFSCGKIGALSPFSRKISNARFRDPTFKCLTQGLWTPRRA
jgi:hypothetical protein